MSLTNLSHLKYAVFDLETTGLDPSRGDEIIEFGAIKMNGLEILEQETFQALVNPKRAIPEEATRVNGITNDDVKNAPILEDVLPSFLDFIGNRVLVAQNASFDLGFLEKAMSRLRRGSLITPVVDTMLLSRFLFSYEQRHNLDAIAARLNIRNEWDRHRSLGDCWLTAKVLIELVHTLNRRGMETLSDIDSCLKKMEVQTQPEDNLTLF